MKRSIQLSLSAALLLLAFLLSWAMWERTREQLLWGYRPLILFLAVWGATVLFLQPIWLNKGTPWRWLALSGLSVLLLSLGFPDTLLPFPLALFAGFVPLLKIEQEISSTEGLRRGATVWKYAFITFLGWNILTTFWVSNTALSAGIFAMIANAILMTLPFLLFHYTRRRLPALGYTAFAAYWLSWEYFHLNWDLTWPWLTLGNGFAEWYWMVQWYEYTGVFGGSLWILLGNILLFSIWKARQEEKPVLRPSLQLAGWLALPVGLSLYMYVNHEESGRQVEMVIVQPNYEPHYEKFTVPREAQVERMERLADSLIRPATDYVVYPEAVIHNFDLNAPRTHPAMRAFEAHFQSQEGLNLLIGASAFEILPRGSQSSPVQRVFVNRRGDTTLYESSNIAAQLTIGQSEIQVYKKSKLVPGPEIFPFQDVLWIFKPIVEKVGGTTAGLATQKERSVFDSETGKVGPLICYESVFGEFVTGYIRRGAEALVIMTNDGWWDDSPGHRQHLRFASLRAIETRRSIARAANTGISAFINQRGDLLERLGYGETGAIRGSVRFRDGLTFYVRWGNIIARIAAFLSGLLALNLVARLLGSSRRST